MTGQMMKVPLAVLTGLVAGGVIGVLIDAVFAPVLPLSVAAVLSPFSLAIIGAVAVPLILPRISRKTYRAAPVAGQSPGRSTHVTPDMAAQQPGGAVAAVQPPRQISALRRAHLATVIALIVQYGLGMGVDLFVSLPGSGRLGQAFTHGPALAIHAVLGLLLIIMAITVLVWAILARHSATAVTAALGLAAIMAAAVNGDVFLGNGSVGSSMGMAMSAGAALLCYVTGLFALSQPGGSSDRP